MSIISDFYDKYDGHEESYLQIIFNKLKDENTDGLIYLAGDSSLDNKHWLKPPYTTEKRVNAVNGYETIPNFDTSGCIQDVAYHINNEINEFNKIHSKEIKMACINTSIEATKLANRKDYNDDGSNFLSSDKFIFDHITNKDTLIVSVGGNDIALGPTLEIQQKFGLLASDLTNPDAISYFKNMFEVDLVNYIKKLIKKNTPKNIIICMVYYPYAGTDQSGFAQGTLSRLGYNSNQTLLKSIINLFYTFIQNIQKDKLIENTNIIPCPLFEVLDLNNKNHYYNSVEPSEVGGRLMAKNFFWLIRYKMKYFKYIFDKSKQDETRIYLDNHIIDLAKESKELNNGDEWNNTYYKFLDKGIRLHL